jgi:uncharacterized protein with NAD-binding domain and iron-sulfur cluster
MVETVAIFGGGVAGLSAAHELVERGFDVTVYEARDRFGGKARSHEVRLDAPGGPRLPGEHGFRFFPGFYWHVVDTMSRIPDGEGSVADNLVSTDETLVASAHGTEALEPTRTPSSVSDWLSVFAPPRMTDVPRREALFFGERMLELLTSCRERREAELEHVSWWEYVEADRMSRAYRRHVAQSTQSHVALRPEKASARSMGRVFLQLLRGHLDADLAAERVLNAPTSESWIDPWLDHLDRAGVSFEAGASLEALRVDDGAVSGATVERNGDTERVVADHYVAAVPVQVMRRLADADLRRAAPSLRGLDRLATDWMNGVQFYLSTDVALSAGHQVYTDSPWALTSISQHQFWETDAADRSDGAVRGVLSVIVSDWHTPGVVHDRPARECDPAEIREEVWAQLVRHLNRDGRTRLEEAEVVDWALDPAIEPREDGEGVRNADPLFVNTVGALEHRPSAETEIPNLSLAGDYVRTNTDLASMEGANEAARRATNAVLAHSDVDAERCAVREFPEPAVFDPLKAADRMQYRSGLPHPGAARRSVAGLFRPSGLL